MIASLLFANGPTRFSFPTMFILSATIFVFTACSEDADPKPYESQVRLLAGDENKSKSWTIETFTANGQSVTLPDCQKDNVITFSNNKDQAYTFTAGAEKCDEDDGELIEEGSWFFSIDGTKVAINAAKFYRAEGMNFFTAPTAKPGKIIELTETTFKLQLSAFDGSNPSNANASEIMLTLKSKVVQ